MGIERLNEFWPEWKIVEEIGQGSYGKVYKAVNEEAGFPVYSAIKALSIPSSKAEVDTLMSEGMTEKESKSYFRGIVDDFSSEIKLMHTLKGAPNVVAVEAFKIAEKADTVGWDIFIRMELLIPFKDYMKSHTFSEDDIIKLGVDVASALEICSRKNIIHRDIKPANIFIDEFGNFKLGDFGIAKELEKNACTMSSKGTFGYMAPEVAKSGHYDATVDIYSLGLVLYSLCNNNRPPFIAADKTDISYNDRKESIDRRLGGERLPAPKYASKALGDIILTACEYDPKRRFISPTVLKKALLNYQSKGNTPVAQASNIPPMVTPAVVNQPAVVVTPANTAYEKTVSIRTAPPEQRQTAQSPIGPNFTATERIRIPAAGQITPPPPPPVSPYGKKKIKPLSSRLYQKLCFAASMLLLSIPFILLIISIAINNFGT